VVGEGSINLGGGKTYKLVDLCIEPKTFAVEEESTSKRGESKKEFVPTKLVTRQTYTLAGISGDIKVSQSAGSHVITIYNHGDMQRKLSLLMDNYYYWHQLSICRWPMVARSSSPSRMASTTPPPLYKCLLVSVCLSSSL